MNETLVMILQMSVSTLLHVGLTFLMWRFLRGREITTAIRIGIGIVYGLSAVLSTHFGVDYGSMILNVRDLGPMSAGLFFDPVSGIIAGIIGGVERYIAGTYFAVGSFTRIACSVSTCLAGVLAAFMNIFIFKGKKPSAAYSLFMGAVIEVFHMYVVLITHRDNMEMAFLVVSVCAVPMILFSGAGLALSSTVLTIGAGEWKNPFIYANQKDVPISQKIQLWLFGVAAGMMILSFLFSYAVQTATAEQEARDDIKVLTEDIRRNYTAMNKNNIPHFNIIAHAGTTGRYYIFDDKGNYVASTDGEYKFTDMELRVINDHGFGDYFNMTLKNEIVFCCKSKLEGNRNLLVSIPKAEIYTDRNRMAYETLLADILIFTVIYVLVSLLVQHIVVHNLHLVNKSLRKITKGNLNEKVNVYYASEFTSLSDDINQTVSVLKGYINAAEKRMEQELLLARNIQASALPTNFDFKHDGFEIYAGMKPARHVGGDFYDFFFVESDKLALVIADVAGKGIPAAMFMMRSKTAIRSLAETGNMPAEIFEKANERLCEGNEANMFVTAWLGIIDLRTGVMRCVNAGHEYPVIKRANGDFELYKDTHRPALGAMEDMTYSEYEIEIGPGDVIYVYTDGIPEAVNEKVEQYGTDRLLDAMNRHKGESMKDLLSSISEDLNEFVGEADQFDDVTMLGFKYNGMQE